MPRPGFPSYFKEDFTTTPDLSLFLSRWAVRLNGLILDDPITFYHTDKFYPSLRCTKDYYLTMDNGVRFKIFEGFVSGFKVTTEYNRKPAKGTGD